MTNKRYYRTNVNLEDNNHEPYYNIRDKKKEGNNVLFMVGGKYTSKEIVDKLNEKEERIRELEKENERLKEKEEYCDNICKSFGDYYGMNIENAEWFGFNGDVE